MFLKELLKKHGFTIELLDCDQFYVRLIIFSSDLEYKYDSRIILKTRPDEEIIKEIIRFLKRYSGHIHPNIELTDEFKQKLLFRITLAKI